MSFISENNSEDLFDIDFSVSSIEAPDSVANAFTASYDSYILCP